VWSFVKDVRTFTGSMRAVDDERWEVVYLADGNLWRLESPHQPIRRSRSRLKEGAFDDSRRTSRRSAASQTGGAACSGRCDRAQTQTT
jgi:hypothetical protein